MILLHLNYLAVIVCAIIYFAIGGMWFSPMLFANTWMEGHGITMPTDDVAKAAMRKQMPRQMAITFLVCLIATMGLAYLATATYANSWMTGAKLGIIAGVFATISIGLSHMYTRKSFKTFAIDAAYHIVSLFIVGIILGVWR